MNKTVRFEIPLPITIHVSNLHHLCYFIRLHQDYYDRAAEYTHLCFARNLLESGEDCEIWIKRQDEREVGTRYNFSASLPPCIQEVLDHCSLVLEETRTMLSDKIIQVFSCPSFPGLEVTIDSNSGSAKEHSSSRIEVDPTLLIWEAKHFLPSPSRNQMWFIRREMIIQMILNTL